MSTHKFQQSTGRTRQDFHSAVRSWRAFKIMQTMGIETYDYMMANRFIETCPACPNPGENLPEGWELDPNGYAFLQSLDKTES